jgi:hypothetical protein
MFRPGRFLVAIAAWMVVSGLALPSQAAGLPAPLGIAATDPFLAGEFVAISWNRPDVRAFDEMEVVLSLDGGRTWPVRISHDLSPETVGTAFRIPSFPASEARVGLRAGRRGERESETLVAWSAPFRISVPVRGVQEALWRSGGEWRTAEAMEGQVSDGPVIPAVLGSPALIRDVEEGPDVDDGNDESLVSQDLETGPPPEGWSGARTQASPRQTPSIRSFPLSRRE